MPKPRLGVILEFGFHEVKKYIFSGFCDLFRERFDFVWLALNKENRGFDAYFRNTGFPLVYFSPADFEKAVTTTEARNQAVRRTWMQSKGLGAFHNYRMLGSGWAKRLVLGNDVTKRFYELKTLRQVRRRYFSSAIQATLLKERLDLLLGTRCSSCFAKSMYITAIRSNIKAWLMVNSWKDLYIDNFIPTTGLEGLIVWSQNMLEEYLYHMPYLATTNLFVGGNPSFDFLASSSPQKTRAFYAEKYGISEKARWFYYTMAPPGIINDEFQTVMLIARHLGARCGSADQVILVRKNPNHNASEFDDIPLPANVRLTQHYCEYDKDSDMIIQSKEGEEEYRDLVNYAFANISIPSTVTLEFIIKQKPVFNVGFGPDGREDSRLAQHVNAGFYRRLFARKDVILSRSIEELVGALDTAAWAEPVSVDNIVVLPECGATTAVMHIILNALHAKQQFG